jgi:predicted ABC-type ATPase
MGSPKIVMIAGPNGAGKSTITAQFRQKADFPGNYINPDEIVLNMTEIVDPIERVYAAAREADRQRQELLMAKASMAFETVMSHPSKIEFLTIAKQIGYQVMLIFVGVDDPEISVLRVKQRVASGGHDVPRQKIIDRYQRVMSLLPQAIQTVDRAILFDNSSDLTGAKLVAEFLNGQLSYSETILPAWAVPIIR